MTSLLGVACWFVVYISRCIYRFLNVCPFDYMAVAGSGKMGPYTSLYRPFLKRSLWPTNQYRLYGWHSPNLLKGGNVPIYVYLLRLIINGLIFCVRIREFWAKKNRNGTSWRPPHRSASCSIEETDHTIYIICKVLFFLQDQQVTVFFSNHNHDVWPIILRRNYFWTAQRHWTLCFHTVF